MILTPKFKKYLSGQRDDLTEEDIKWYQLMVEIHSIKPTNIKAGNDTEEYVIDDENVK